MVLKHTHTHSQEMDLFYALCFPLSGKVGNSIKSTVEEITLGAGGYTAHPLMSAVVRITPFLVL